MASLTRLVGHLELGDERRVRSEGHAARANQPLRPEFAVRVRLHAVGPQQRRRSIKLSRTEERVLVVGLVVVLVVLGFASLTTSLAYNALAYLGAAVCWIAFATRVAR